MGTDVSSRRVVVIGLDCVPDSLVFHDLRDELPALRSLMDHGLWGTLLSTDPPITIPAWTTITTGLDPGELGLYGFRNRLDSSGYGLTVVNASHVHARRVWDHVEDRGGSSILIGIPQTYPPLPHRGVTVAGFPTPEFSTPYCYPDDLSGHIARLTNGRYSNDVKEFRKKDRAALLLELYNAAENRFNVARDLVSREPWAFFMMVETATDRLHHGFWADYDPAHGLHVPHSPFRTAIPEYYRFLDAEVAALLELLPEDTTVMVISDHGAGPLRGAVAVNQWLMDNGYLALLEEPQKETALSPDMVDWSRTTAWGEGGYYARIFFNVAGRERHGIVPAHEYEGFREELIRGLENMMDGKGHFLRNRVLIPEQIYRSCRNVPPDVMVYFDDLRYRSSGTVGHSDVFLDGAGEGMDQANHTPYGMFIMARMADVRSGRSSGSRASGTAKCLDITPTVLFEMGLAVPEGLAGRPITWEPRSWRPRDSSAVPSSLGAAHEESSDQPAGFSAEEEEIIKKRLEDLGYM